MSRRPERAGQLSRTDYYWVQRSALLPLLHAAYRGDPAAYLKEYHVFDAAFAAAARAADSWQSAEDIAKPLIAAGILGAGPGSALTTDTLHDPAAPKGPNMFPVKLINFAVKYLGMVSTIWKMSLFVFKISAKTIQMQGFLINDSPFDLRLTFDPEPYFNNCASATAPLEEVLPAPRKIAHPVTQEMHDCVAVQILSADNDNKHEGAFVTMLGSMKPGPVALGFGIPYLKGIERSIVTKTNAMSAPQFYDDWDHDRPHFRSSTEVGYSLMTKQDQAFGKSGRFALVVGPPPR